MREIKPFIPYEGNKAMTDAFDMQDYLFDLRGFIILKNAVSPELVERLNRAIDPFLDLQYLEWRGNVQRFDPPSSGPSMAMQSNVRYAWSL